MSSATTAAQSFLDRLSEFGDTWYERAKQLPDAVRKEFWRLKKASYFDPKNKAEGSEKEYLSPSGRYKLVTCSFGTGKGSWNYTQGTVYKIGCDTPIAVIQRNYSHFPYTWVEGHPNGHDYFVGGEDYQGQTVIELDTGKRRDHLPKAAEKGGGFCWVDYSFLPEQQLMHVEGCVWAGPYEHVFYDFSDPMSGWPELEYVDKKGELAWVDADLKVAFEGDKLTVSKVFDDPDWEGEPGADKEGDVVATVTYRRDGEKLVFHEEWMTLDEAERRRAREESEREYERRMKEFKATDPLYLLHKSVVEQPPFSAESYVSYGMTYEGWCPDWKGKERRWCRRIVKTDALSIDLEWAEKTGPIKLVIHKDKKTETKFFMEHSVESMQTALDYAKAVLPI